MIAPLVPPQSPLQELIHGPRLDPPALPSADKDILYGMSTVGGAGRLVETFVMTGLGWTPGTRLAMTADAEGRLLVVEAPNGAVTVTADGYFRVPYRQRRRLRLFLGDRVLLMGHRARKRLLVHTPASIETGLADSARLVARR
ncbi:hypothetical protein FMUAM8_30230 [Nocardia cyriacigeorgica]|nr:hypothetical protein FMUAM8_30230 [Nocardia cyriacigeorgica]